MKKIVLMTILFCLFLSSCGQHNPSFNKIVIPDKIISGNIKKISQDIISIAKAMSAKKESIQTQEKISTHEDTQSDNTTSTTHQDINFIATHMPADGAYINRTNGGFPHTCEIRVQKESDNSFRFSIWEVINENREDCNDIIFMENIASFDSPNQTTAVFYGQTYTVYLDCSAPSVIKLSGFDQATTLGDSFVNMDSW